MKKKNVAIVLLSLCLVFTTTLSVVLMVRGGYFKKVLVKLNLAEETTETNWALNSWENCIEQLNYDADIAFFGDSITCGGSWQEAFPEYNVINLGYSGDTLSGMIGRVDSLTACDPEIIFVMGGINGLKYYGVESSIEYYGTLIDEISGACPDSEIVIQSLTPVTEVKEKDYGSNEDIRSFNEALRKLAEEKGLMFVDVYCLYEDNGYMNEDMTSDGIHIKHDNYYCWYELLRETLNR